MTKEEYRKLIDLTLDMRVIASILSEAVHLQEKISSTLRELLIKEDTNALD